MYKITILFSKIKFYLITDRTNPQTIIPIIPQNQTITVGSKFTMKCNIPKEFLANVQWFHGTCQHCKDIILTVMSILLHIILLYLYI